MEQGGGNIFWGVIKEEEPVAQQFLLFQTFRKVEEREEYKEEGMKEIRASQVCPEGKLRAIFTFFPTTTGERPSSPQKKKTKHQGEPPLLPYHH